MSLNRLRELRKESGKTINDIAIELGIPYQTFRNYEIEKRHPKKETWEKLAKHFNVSTPYIMGLSDERNDKTSKNSSEVADFIYNSTEIESIADMMKEIVTKGDLEKASKITSLLGEFALILSYTQESKDLDQLEIVIHNLREISANTVLIDLQKNFKSVEDYHKKHDIKGKTVEEVREIEKMYPKPKITFKDLETLLQDFQSILSETNEALTKIFSRNASKLFNK